MPRLSELTNRDVMSATARVRQELRASENAALRGDRTAAYAAAERAQEAAFDLKQLFTLSSKEMEVGKELFSEEPGHGHQEAGDLP